MEYEDSYVYTVVGRQMYLGRILNSADFSPYLTTVCAAGNLKSCEITETYSGHYIGLPYVIAVTSRVVGYTPDIASTIGIAAAMVSVALVFLIGTLVGGEALVGTASALVFATTPIFAVNAAIGSPEPLSSAVLAAALLFFLRFVHAGAADNRTEGLSGLACFFNVLLAVTIKRENLMLAVVLPITGLFVLASAGTGMRDLRRKMGWMVIGVCLVMLFSFQQLELFNTLSSETGEYGQYPFSVAQLRVMLPLFGMAVAKPTWYGAMVVFVIVGVVEAVRNRDLKLYPLALLAAFVALYSGHVRSYYQLHYGDVTPYETLRYSINLMGPWSVLAGCGVAATMQWLGIASKSNGGRKTQRLASAAVVCVYLGFLLWATIQLGRDWASEEFQKRVKPALTAAEYVSKRAAHQVYVITLEPLVFQMYAPATSQAIDATIVHQIPWSRLRASAQIIYVEQPDYQDRANRDRYARQFSYITAMRMAVLYRDESVVLWQLKMPAASKSRE